MSNKRYWKRIEEIQRKQTEKGIQKYGVILEDNIDLTFEERINHLQEELIDALMYCEHLREMYRGSGKVKIINKSNNQLPEYATIGSAGMDLRAFTEEPIYLEPNKVTKIPTGIYIELPQGYEAQIRSRSGIAFKGIIMANGIGTIDSDYRGEVGILLLNTTDKRFKIQNGDRIAQMVIAKYEQVEWQEVEELSDSERGAGGYGSTGKN